MLLLVAGHETTVGLISNAILALLRHPDQLALLQASPDLAASAVEETLRYDAPGADDRLASPRGGMQVGARGRAATARWSCCCWRRPGGIRGRLPRPGPFDIRRGATGHLAFAAGPHFCLGAPLARLEAAIALEPSPPDEARHD